MTDWNQCEGCDGSGIRFPAQSNGDDSFDWVERCDTCERFESDEDAAFVIGERLGREVRYLFPFGANHPQPFLHNPERDDANAGI